MHAGILYTSTYRKRAAAQSIPQTKAAVVIPCRKLCAVGGSVRQAQGQCAAAQLTEF